MRLWRPGRRCAALAAGFVIVCSVHGSRTVAVSVDTRERPEMSQVCALPADNLIRNPWFRSGERPSLAGWHTHGPPEGGWGASQKPGNPTPDEVVGTAARLSTGRGAARRGANIDPHADAYLEQVVAADPEARNLHFHMYWVTHTVDPAVVTVFGGPAPEGPWTQVWRPFHQIWRTRIVPESGRGQELWAYYSNLTAMASVQLETGFPYYKLEIRASLPDEMGGLKITGVYFSVGSEATENAGIHACHAV